MKHDTIEKIKKELYLHDVLQKDAEFQCYADGIATYHVYEEDKSFHELGIINKDATFFKEHNTNDLLELKNTSFLSHRYFVKLDPIAKESHQLIGGIIYRSEDENYWDDKD